MIPRRKDAASRRAEIVSAALSLAAERGPQKATADAIATCIGVTQPAIFRHFPHKADMWQAVLQWLQERLHERWAAAATAAPAARVEAIVAAHLQFVAQFPAMPMVLLSPELRRSCQAIGQGSERLIGAFHAAMADAVREGQCAGLLSTRIAAEDAAHMVLALVQGTALRWAVGGHRFDLPEEGGRLTRMAIQGLVGTGLPDSNHAFTANGP